jgi:hypothetical protein
MFAETTIFDVLKCNVKIKKSAVAPPTLIPQKI